MNTDTQGPILLELRSLRDDFNTHSRETGERLSSLEAQMHSILGNGQPGRIGAIEADVKSLAAWRWRIAGICSGISTAISVIGWVLLHFVH